MELFLSSLKYLGIYIATGAGILVIFVISVDPIYKLIFGYKVSDKDKHTHAQKVVLLLWVIFTIGSPYLILNYGFDYEPPFIKQLDKPHSAEDRISILSQEVDRINTSLSGIENLTIKEIQEELTSTLKFAQKMKAEAETQEKLISALRHKAEEERKNSDKLKAIAKNIASLSMEQIEGIKYVITEDAKDESKKGFWLGVLISFPLGVLSSMVATMLFRNIRRKANKANLADAKSRAAD